MTTIDIIFNEARNQISAQIKEIESLKRRVEQVIALDAVVIAAIVQSSSPNLKGSFSELGILLLLGGVFLGLLLYKPKEYSYDPHPKKLYHKYLDKKPQEVKEQLVANWIDTFEKNEPKIKQFAKELKDIFWLSFFGILLVVMQMLI